MLDLVFDHTGGHAYSTLKLAQYFATKARRDETFDEVRGILCNPYLKVLERCSFPSDEELSLDGASSARFPSMTTTSGSSRNIAFPRRLLC
jgi:hypothetical protein